MDAALLAIEQAFFGNTGGGGFVFHQGVVARGIDVREGVGTAVGADEQRVALRVVVGAGCGRGHAHQAAVAVLGVSGADAFGNDAALGVAAQMDHLGAGVGLLEVVADRD